MTRLKTILQSKYLYVLLLMLTGIYCFYYFNIPHNSKLDINKKDFIGTIVGIEVEGNLLKIELNGNEKIIGNYIFQTEEEKVNFIKFYELGDIVEVSGSFSLPKNNTVPNLFNYKDYLNQKHIYYIMSIDKLALVEKNTSLFYSMKNIILDHIDSYKSKGYLMTFILGNDSLLDDDTVKSYQQNGISHLFALSGMHISLLSGVLLFLFKKIKLKEYLSYLLVILFLVFYMFLSGNSPSICRAVLLFILVSINKIFKLGIPTIFLLIMTFCLLLLVDPYLLFQVGFQYSFTISLYLILLQGRFNDKSYIKSLIKMSLISFLVSLPISIYYFYQINILSVFLNLIFVPFVSFVIFPFSLLTFFLPFLDSFFWFLTNLMEKLSLFFYDISIFQFILGKPNMWWIILYYLFLLGCIYYERKLYWFMLIGLLLYQYFLLVIIPKNFLMTIDVGQGDSILIHANNKTVLIDTGGKYVYEKDDWQKKSVSNLTEQTLMPLLKSFGIKGINSLIVSHGDYDHMGEAINLVNNFKVEKVIFNCGSYNDLEQELIKELDKKHIKYYFCIRELNIDKNRLYFLQTKLYDNENDNSNVIYTELNGYKFLFMGDSSVTTEEEIMNKYNLFNIDVLKVGHHGSKTSSSKEFIDKINPKYSIISVGKNNRYGHPNKEVLNNLRDSKIYRTDQDGSIMFKIKDNRLKIENCNP